MSKITTNSATDQTKPSLFDVGTVARTKIQIGFDAPDISSLGGLLLTKSDSNIIRFLSEIASCIRDTRLPHLVRHSTDELVYQRVGQIVCGFEDANDCDSLRQDSMLKMFCGARPDGAELASQPSNIDDGIIHLHLRRFLTEGLK